MQMNSTKLMETETQESSSETDVMVRVESVEGNITPQDNTQTEAAVDMQQVEEQTAAEGDSAQVQSNTDQAETQTDTGTVQADNAQAQETAVVQPEASQYLSQGYYIVQKGDSLVGICRKVYNTTAMMDKLCETNGIDNPDAIYEGQYLTLPN